MLLQKCGNSKEVLVTMDNYQDRKLHKMPTPKPYKDITEAELQHVLTTAINYNQLIPALIEANRRKDEQIHALSKRITALEEKASKKAGRKRQTFYLDGKELTDEDIVYYIREDYYTIPELERLVGAKKNQLRNRYNRVIQGR